MGTITYDNVQGFFYGVLFASVVIGLVILFGSRKGGR